MRATSGSKARRTLLKHHFKINSQGTPLDDVEEMLLRNRTKAIAIGSCAILRAGTGNKYWSKFPAGKQEKIEKAAADFHELLFDPEADLEVRTVSCQLAAPFHLSTHSPSWLIFDYSAVPSAAAQYWEG